MCVGINNFVNKVILKGSITRNYLKWPLYILIIIKRYKNVALFIKI